VKGPRQDITTDAGESESTALQTERVQLQLVNRQSAVHSVVFSAIIFLRVSDMASAQT
jgi:hypothetical protein